MGHTPEDFGPGTTLHIDPRRGIVTVDGNRLDLTPTELSTLLHLSLNPYLPSTYQELIEATWGNAWSGAKENLHVVISNIRRKARALQPNPLVATIRNVGYQLHPQCTLLRTHHDPANALETSGVTMSPMTDRANAGDPGNTSPWVFLGIDGETSTANVNAGGRLIQAGAAAWSHGPGGPIDIFCSLLNHASPAWDPRAAAVHGITRDQLRGAPAPEDVDDAFYHWLIEHGADPNNANVVPIGFNVTSFDLPFFQRSLPRSAALISHRGVDLNSVCFTFADWDPDPERVTSPRDFHGWKDSAKEFANNRLASVGIAEQEHDAGYDAAQALIAWWYLKRALPAPSL